VQVGQQFSLWDTATIVNVEQVGSGLSRVVYGYGYNYGPGNAIDASAEKLALKERFIYAQAPVDTRTENQLQAFLDWASAHAATGHAGSPWFLDQVDGHSRLEAMEQALRACTLWLWLDLRFPGAYGHVQSVLALRSQLNDGIERQLKGKRPLAQMRDRQRRGRY